MELYNNAAGGVAASAHLFSSEVTLVPITSSSDHGELLVLIYRTVCYVTYLY